jgi:hypothetical protein
MLGRLHIFHERIGDCAITTDLAARAVAIAEALRLAGAPGHGEALGVASRSRAFRIIWRATSGRHCGIWKARWPIARCSAATA